MSFNLESMVLLIHLKAKHDPFALKQLIKEELDLINAGVLEPESHTHWEAPIVMPIKDNGALHTCEDYKCTLNKAL